VHLKANVIYYREERKLVERRGNYDERDEVRAEGCVQQEKQKGANTGCRSLKGRRTREMKRFERKVQLGEKKKTRMMKRVYEKAQGQRKSEVRVERGTPEDESKKIINVKKDAQKTQGERKSKYRQYRKIQERK